MTVIRSASGVRIDCDECAHHTAAHSLPLDELRSMTGYVPHNGADFCPSCWYAHTTSRHGTSHDRSTRAPAPEPPPNTGRSAVVIVDDEPMFRELARRLLAARGYDVVAEAACAASALNAVERHAPHAVLLDVHLGADDGYAVCELLMRSRPDLAVLLTSAVQAEDSDLITRCGACGFVQKARLPQIDLGQFWPSE